MNRVNDKAVKISDKRTRYTFRIYDDPTEPESLEARKRQIGFLQDLVDQPALLTAGHTYARKMAIWHDGSCWVLSGEVEADDA